MAQKTHIPRKGQDADFGSLTATALSIAGVDVTYGKNFFLDPTNGNDTNDGKSFTSAKKTLAAAYALLTDNANDTLYYIAGTSGINLSATFTWAKSYTHLVGLCSPVSVSPRSRFFQLSTATGVSPLFDITGNGCIFKNILWFQGVNDATSLIAVRVTGDRNYFENCHFAGGGNAACAVDGCSSLYLSGADENRFAHCTIGLDTIEAATGVNALTLIGSCSRNQFEECLFELLAGNSGAVLVELMSTSAVDRWNEFNRCGFFANSVNKATTIASAFVIPAGHTITATIFINDPRSALGFTDWDANNRGLLYLNRGTLTGGGNSGYAVVSNAT